MNPSTTKRGKTSPVRTRNVAPLPDAEDTSLRALRLVSDLRRARQWASENSFPVNPVTTRLREHGYFTHDGERYDAGHRASDDVCGLMAGLIRTKNYRDVLEIGTLYGYSTLHLAEAADALDGSVTTVDLRLERRKWHTGQEIRNVHEVAVRLIGEAGYASVVSFLVGNSNAVLPGLILEARQFDLIFVDGSHSFPAVVLDVIAADLLLRSDGVIILDDVSEGIARKDFTSGGPNRLLPSLFASGRFEIVPLSANHVALGQREAGR